MGNINYMSDHCDKRKEISQEREREKAAIESGDFTEIIRRNMKRKEKMKKYRASKNKAVLKQYRIK